MVYSASDGKKLIGKKVLWIKSDIHGTTKDTKGIIKDVDYDEDLKKLDYKVEPDGDSSYWIHDITIIKILNEENTMNRAKEYLKSKGLLIEDVNMSAVDFMAKLDSTIRSVFPDSHIYISNRVLGNDSIHISFALGKDNKEWINGIIQNDPANNHYWMHDSIDSLGNIKSIITIESAEAGSIYNKDHNRIKTGWMKKTGSPDKILDHLKKHFIKMKEVGKQNKDSIHPIVQDKF